MKIEQLDFPDRFKDSHFRYKSGEEWYLVPLEARTTDEDTTEFECWMYNTKGKLLSGVPYQKTARELGLI